MNCFESILKSNATMNGDYKRIIVNTIKHIFGINDLTLFLRRKRQSFERLFYHEKYTADDIIHCIKSMGVPTGVPIIVHSSLHNFYNYKGTVDELIDKLLDYVGPNGTLSMPAFMEDKNDEDKIFDVRNTPSAAGYLTEVFRGRVGVKRSINHLHSVCAFGKDADKIVSEHHNSRICFDEHSPFYIMSELDGYIVNLGMPKWYVGTCEHICEALLYGKLKFFTDKFISPVKFKYIDYQGNYSEHIMYTNSKHAYVRRTDTKLFDLYFAPDKFKRVKLSNIWVTSYNMNYLYKRLYTLAQQGETIYKYPKFYQ